MTFDLAIRRSSHDETSRPVVFTAHGRRKAEQGAAWTESRIESLKKLWSDGLSASQIAAELGGITRNAVIGKVHRLGLSGRAKSTASLNSRPRKPRKLKPWAALPSTRGNTALAMNIACEPLPEEPELLENIVPIGQRRGLFELNEHTCRWPVGDPASQEFFFCGGPPVDGKNGSSAYPYCSYHSRVAYQPPAARRDRRPGRV